MGGRLSTHPREPPAANDKAARGGYTSHCRSGPGGSRGEPGTDSARAGQSHLRSMSSDLIIEELGEIKRLISTFKHKGRNHSFYL